MISQIYSTTRLVVMVTAMIKKLDTLYFKPKYLCVLLLFCADLEKFSEIKSGNLKKRREKVHDIISDLYSD